MAAHPGTDHNTSVAIDAFVRLVRTSVAVTVQLSARLQRDCPREETLPGPADVLSAHGRGTGVGFG